MVINNLLNLRQRQRKRRERQKRQQRRGRKRRWRAPPNYRFIGAWTHIKLCHEMLQKKLKLHKVMVAYFRNFIEGFKKMNRIHKKILKFHQTGNLLLLEEDSHFRNIWHRLHYCYKIHVEGTFKDYYTFIAKQRLVMQQQREIFQLNISSAKKLKLLLRQREKAYELISRTHLAITLFLSICYIRELQKSIQLYDQIAHNYN